MAGQRLRRHQDAAEQTGRPRRDPVRAVAANRGPLAQHPIPAHPSARVVACAANEPRPMGCSAGVHRRDDQMVRCRSAGPRSAGSTATHPSAWPQPPRTGRCHTSLCRLQRGLPRRQVWRITGFPPLDTPCAHKWGRSAAYSVLVRHRLFTFTPCTTSATIATVCSGGHHG